MTSRGGVRAAIVGAGLMGRWHAHAASSAGARIVAVFDAEARAAAALAAKYHATVVDSVQEAAAAGVEVAHVCTPPDTHLSMTRAALAAGLHAIVEKPLAANAEETDVILRIAEQSGRLITPVHQFPFQRGVQRIVDALPRLGTILHAQVVACSAGALDDPTARDRVAFDILPHPLSLFATVLHAPIAATEWHVRHPMPGELLATATSGQTTLTALVSMSGRPTTNSFRLIGTGGTAYADLFHGFDVIEAKTVSRGRKIIHPFALSTSTFGRAMTNLVRRAATRELAYPGLRALIAAFYAAVRGEQRAPISAAQTRDIARARDVIIAATRVVP